MASNLVLTGRIYEGGLVREFPYEPSSDDFRRMGIVLTEAALAAEAGDSPIAAMLVAPDGREHVEQTHEFRDNDLMGHAETRLLRKLAAGRRLGQYTMYCSAEPCVGCSYYLDKGELGMLFVGATREEVDFFRARDITMGAIFGESVRTLRVVPGLMKTEALGLLSVDRRKHWDNGRRD